ncbi:Replicase polyprotein 1ab, partial [Clarias magur]
MHSCHVPNVNISGPSCSSTFLRAVLGFGRLIPALLDDTVSKNVKSAWGSEL